MSYHEITCQKAANHIHSSRLPYEWDLNIYRGCTHNCQYCFALYSHQYMEGGGFFDDIYVKINAPEQLERQLKSKNWKQQIINIGGVTDSYQAAEATYKLMPEILRLMIRYKNPVIISTKSTLILRDFELIEELARLTYVNIAATVTTMDERIRRALEPGAMPSVQRLEMLRAFRKTEASIGVHTMPIVPFLTDSEENLEQIFAYAKEIDAHYLLTSSLNLRGETRKVFFAFLRREFPEVYRDMQKLYKAGGVDKVYRMELQHRLRTLQKKYQLSGNFQKEIARRLHTTEYEQLRFF